MSTRSLFIIGLIVVFCVAVIAISALGQERLAPRSGPFRFRDLSGMFHFPDPRPFGEPQFLPRSSPLYAGSRGIASGIASYAFLFLAGLLTLFAFPRRARIVRDAFGRGAGPWMQALGTGAFCALVLLLLTVLGFLTYPAFPIALLLPVALLLAAWGGLVGLALACGRALSHLAGTLRPAPVLELALGLLLLFTLTRIPILGWVIAGVLVMLALGAALMTRFGAGGAWSLAEFYPTKEGQP